MIPVIAITLTPQTPADERNLAAGLDALTTADPSSGLRVRPSRDEASGLTEFLIGAASEEELEMLLDRLKRQLGVSARVSPPTIVYMNAFSMSDHRRPPLHEPVMELELKTPEAFLGDVLRDLNGRRAVVVSMKVEADARIVTAYAPMAALLGYRSAFETLTHGRGTHRLTFFRYAPITREPDASEDDHISHVGAPRRPIPPPNTSHIALPEPDDDEDDLMLDR